MSLGFADDRFGGGFSQVIAIDNDRAAVETHKANFSGDAVCANVETWLQEAAVPQADVVIGGPPCQGFSLLNKKRTGDSRRALWEPYLDIVKRSGARLFVMENVAELYRSLELDAIRKRAAGLGFKTDAAILNTADYGTPQTRKRTIVFGWKEGLWASQFPPLASHAQPGTKSNRRPWVTVREAIGDLPEPVRVEITGPAPLDLHIKRTPTDKSLARYRAVPPGGNRFDLQRSAPEITPVS